MDATLILNYSIIINTLPEGSGILDKKIIEAKRHPKPLPVRPDSTLDASRRKLQAGGIKAIKINKVKCSRKNVILTLSGDRKTLIYRNNSALKSATKVRSNKEKGRVALD